MKAFLPEKLPIKNLDFGKLINLVGEANRMLSLYNGTLRVMINPHILLAPLKTKEAILSSRIEGTQISLTELMQYEAGEKYDDKKNDEALEVLNYKNAMMEAEEMFSNLPNIHLNMIRKLHSTLLNNVRGNNKARGEFRKIQVYIANPGDSIEKAKFIPPEAQNVLPALDNWEKYINNNEQEPLIQCSVMHAQFEIIHPFLDGNGRLGRMLIPLFLYQKNCISKPVFYLSEYFENNREEYYSKLNNITTKNDWNEWVEFFLKAIIEQSKKNMKKAEEILKLYENKKQDFINATHSEFALNILDNLFKKPIISGNELQKLSGIASIRTANSIFKKLINKNLMQINTIGKGTKSTVYAFNDLISLSESN